MQQLETLNMEKAGNKMTVPTQPIGCFLDYTYCASEGCENKCGRQMSPAIKKAIENMPYARVAYSKFCEEKKKNPPN